MRTAAVRDPIAVSVITAPGSAPHSGERWQPPEALVVSESSDSRSEASDEKEQSVSSVLSAIGDKLAAWMEAQPVFFVATAPLSGSGQVNVSPKGMAGTFRVLGPHRVAYLDYHASGVETIAHLREPGNGRICLMFCAFEGRPQVVRIHGRGTVVRKDDAAFAELRRAFSKEHVIGQRAIIVVDAERLSDSCGWAVPLMDFVADRTILDLHQEKKGAAAYLDYGETKNAWSIDGLPAMTRRTGAVPPSA